MNGLTRMSLMRRIFNIEVDLFFRHKETDQDAQGQEAKDAQDDEPEFGHLH